MTSMFLNKYNILDQSSEKIENRKLRVENFEERKNNNCNKSYRKFSE